MQMYNLLQYSHNYFLISGSLRNYYREKVTDAVNEIVANCRLNNNKIRTSKSLAHKTTIIGSTTTNNNT